MDGRPSVLPVKTSNNFWPEGKSADHLPAQKLSQNIDPGLQQIQIGERIIQEPRHHYYMLHKPIGAVTAKRDAHHLTVIELVDPQQEYLDLFYPLGRLDHDTSGLLLLKIMVP